MACLIWLLCETLVWLLHGLSFCSHNSCTSNGHRIRVAGWTSLEDNGDTSELSLAAVDLLPVDVYTSNVPFQGPVFALKFVVLIFDQLVDQSSAVC